jgi:hypothetical protein
MLLALDLQDDFLVFYLLSIFFYGIFGEQFLCQVIFCVIDLLNTSLSMHFEIMVGALNKLLILLTYLIIVFSW